MTQSEEIKKEKFTLELRYQTEMRLLCKQPDDSRLIVNSLAEFSVTEAVQLQLGFDLEHIMCPRARFISSDG